MKDFLEELGEVLDAAGARLSFDPGRSVMHPCTFCGKAERPRELLTLGTYFNGESLTRPVCARCRPMAERRMKPLPLASSDPCEECGRVVCSFECPLRTRVEAENADHVLATSGHGDEQDASEHGQEGRRRDP